MICKQNSSHRHRGDGGDHAHVNGRGHADARDDRNAHHVHGRGGGVRDHACAKDGRNVHHGDVRGARRLTKSRGQCPTWRSN